MFFGVVVGLACSRDTERHAGRSVATGKASHAGHVKGDDPEEKGIS
jgi:hypothetical protein